MTVELSTPWEAIWPCSLSRERGGHSQRKQIWGLLLQLPAAGPQALRAVAIWYYLVPGRALIQPESQGAPQQLSALLVYGEQSHCTGSAGLIWSQPKTADPPLAKLPRISQSTYLSWPSALGPRGTLTHKANSWPRFDLETFKPLMASILMANIKAISYP